MFHKLSDNFLRMTGDHVVGNVEDTHLVSLLREMQLPLNALSLAQGDLVSDSHRGTTF